MFEPQHSSIVRDSTAHRKCDQNQAIAADSGLHKVFNELNHLSALVLNDAYGKWLLRLVEVV